MCARQVDHQVLNLGPGVVNLELAAQPPELESVFLVERESVHINHKIVVLDAWEHQVGSQVSYLHVIGVELSCRLVRLAEHVVSYITIANDGIVDAYVVGCGRLAGLGLELVDDELQVGGAVLVGACHRAMEPVNLGKIENHLAVDDEVIQTHTGP